MSSNAINVGKKDYGYTALTNICLVALFCCALLTGILPQTIIAAAAIAACAALTLTPNIYLAFPIMTFYYVSFGNFMGMSVYRYFSLLFLLATAIRLKDFYAHALQVAVAVLIFLYCLVVVAPNDVRRAIFVIVDMIGVLFLVNYYLPDRLKLEKFFKVYALIALCTYITGLFVNQTFVTTEFVNGEFVEIVRSNSTFEDPNYAGFFLTIAVFAVVALKLFLPKIRWLVVAGIYLTMMTTLSITAIVVNFVLWTIYFLVTKRSKIKVILAVLLVFVIIFGLYSYGVSHPDTPVIGSLSFRVSEKLDALESGDIGQVTTNRADLTEKHWNYFKSQSAIKMLLGFNAASPIRTELANSRIVAHNEYVDLLLNIGILGAVILLFYVFKRTWLMYKRYKTSGDTYSLLVFMVKWVWLLYGLALTMFGDYRFMIAMFI